MKTHATSAQQRPQSLPVRIATVAIIVVAAFLLLRTITRHKLSEAFFGVAKIPTAFAINRNDGIVAGYLAWTLQRSGQGRLAIPIARRALTETPLSAAAVGALALADPTPDRRLLDLATMAGWRDPSLQAWLGRAALDRGDAIQAAQHIDAAARIEGVTGEIRTVVDRMAVSPANRAAIAARLALAPRWRFAYFAGTTEPMGGIASRVAILGALVGSTAPPTPLEVMALTALGARTYGFPYGYDVWRGLTRSRVADFVYDPDFSAASDDPDDANPYRWHLAASAGVASEVTHDNGRAALHVTADGLSAAPVVSQMFRISPGRHRLSVSGHYGTPSAALGFRWSFSCWNARVATTMLSPVSGKATGSAGFVFDVPANGSCPIVRLELATQPAETPSQIEAWFNAVRID